MTMCSNVLLLFSVVLFSGLRPVESSKEGCPEVVQRSHHFAKVHESTCYLFVNRERFWDDARDSCRKLGGEMLSVENYNTMRFVRSVLNSDELGWTKRGVWLGARFFDGAWRWASGKPVGYTYWATGNPGKFLGLFSLEDCALMRSRDNWRWHDYTCSGLKYHFNYICQFPAQNTTTTTTTSTTTTTPTSTSTDATVHKPGYFSEKGQGSDGKDSQLDDHEFYQQDEGQDVQGAEGGHPYDSRHPATNDRGYNEPTTSHFLDNGNLTILTIILVSGGIVLLILLLIFLIVRKRYNYKKAMGQPATVHFENRNYNNGHGGRNVPTAPLPPPPAPHSFHRVPVPPVPPPRPLVPPRPLLTQMTPRGLETILTSPHVQGPYVPHSRPASALYLTPTEIGEGPSIQGCDVYEEIPADVYARTTNLTHTPARSMDTVLEPSASRARRDRCLMRHEDSATIPLMSTTACPWNQSEDSLNDTLTNDPMTSSLTMKTSNIHNDYVDMNGSPVVPARHYRADEAGTSKAGQGQMSVPGGLDNPDPKTEMTMDSGSHAPLPGECKQPMNSLYNNLMTTSQERSENLYAQLH